MAASGTRLPHSSNEVGTWPDGLRSFGTAASVGGPEISGGRGYGTTEARLYPWRLVCSREEGANLRPAEYERTRWFHEQSMQHSTT